MRPVDRGDPTGYSPSQAVVTAVATATAREDKIRALAEEKAGLEREVSPSRKRGLDEDGVNHADVNDLVRAAEGLREEWREAGNDDAKNRAGRMLIANLTLQSELLHEMLQGSRPLINGMYQTARADLITNLGQYCSYCEMPLAASLAVEHMLPKKDFPALAVTWRNFLLACPVRNSIKSKKPSWEDAVKKARATKGGLDVDSAEIIQGGFGLVVWPTDELYVDFAARFRPVVRRVAYGNGGQPIRSEDLAADVLARHVRDGTLVQSGDDGEQISAGFYDKVLLDDNFDPAGLTPLLKEVAVDAPDDLVRTLRETLSGTAGRVGSNGSTFSLSGVPAQPGRPKRQQWTLREERAYKLDLSGTYVSVTGADQPAVTFEEITSASIRGRIGGVLPDHLVKKFVPRPFEWEISVVRDYPSRNEFHLRLARDLVIQRDFGVVSFFRVSRSDIEVVIQPLARSDGEAVRAVEFAGLNRREVLDPKVADRRMIKRTRAFLTAVATIGRVVEASGLGDHQLTEDVMAAAKHTMAGTGFWSIWYWLVSQEMAQGHSVCTELRDVLFDRDTFPGTRPRPN